MAIRDASSERLFVQGNLSPDSEIELDEAQSHYLINVLRLRSGARVLVFNGREGEWEAELAEVRKRSATLRVRRQTRPQLSGPDLDYLFAPLKRSRLDYMVQKATEMGVSRIRPVITERTVAERVKTSRMIANAIEAAEQCGILRIPEVMEPQRLEEAISDWDPQRRLVFCDEASDSDPLTTLRAIPAGPLALLIGPEGGFTDRERSALLAQNYVVPISLGPRVMRADTAAVAALALVNSVLGDWRRQ